MIKKYSDRNLKFLIVKIQMKICTSLSIDDIKKMVTNQDENYGTRFDILF